MQILRTGMVLGILIGLIAGVANLASAMMKDPVTPASRACQDAIDSISSQIGTAIIQNSTLSTKLQTVSRTATVSVPIYDNIAPSPNPSTPPMRMITATVSASGSASTKSMTITASLPSGTTCSRMIPLNPLTLPNNTTTVGNPVQPIQ